MSELMRKQAAALWKTNEFHHRKMSCVWDQRGGQPAWELTVCVRACVCIVGRLAARKGYLSYNSRTGLYSQHRVIQPGAATRLQTTHGRSTSMHIRPHSFTCTHAHVHLHEIMHVYTILGARKWSAAAMGFTWSAQREMAGGYGKQSAA